MKKARRTTELGFLTAVRGGLAVGFFVVSMTVLSFVLLVAFYKWHFVTETAPITAYNDLFISITGFALGASVVALFGRVGGGIFTKAADIGMDLTTPKGEEPSEKNPGLVADFVGDNVGDIVGTVSDLLASLAESACATMILSTAAPALVGNELAIYFPVLIFASGIVVAYLAEIIAARLTHGENEDQIQRSLKNRVFVSAILMTPALIALGYYCLPPLIEFPGENHTASRMQLLVCTGFGQWGGYLIGLSSEYFTSHDYYPVQDVAKSCHTGSATDIIYGLALGYMSTIIPILTLIVVVYIGFLCAGMYGIALAGCGMLCTLATSISVTSYGPITDNASGLAHKCQIAIAIANADELHSAGKVASAQGRSFALGTATIVALAIFGAFVWRHKLPVVDLLQPLEFAGLVIGAMLPYAFSALILESVSTAAIVVKDEIKSQLNANVVDPNKCISICTTASLKGMIGPALIAGGTPFVAGICFGSGGLCGVLAGIIVSGIQIGLSFVNSGAAWDNAKHYIEGEECGSDRREQAGWTQGTEGRGEGDAGGIPAPRNVGRWEAT